MVKNRFKRFRTLKKTEQGRVRETQIIEVGWGTAKYLRVLSAFHLKMWLWLLEAYTSSTFLFLVFSQLYPSDCPDAVAIVSSLCFVCRWTFIMDRQKRSQRLYLHRIIASVMTWVNSWHFRTTPVCDDVALHCVGLLHFVCLMEVNQYKHWAEWHDGDMSMTCKGAFMRVSI